MRASVLIALLTVVGIAPAEAGVITVTDFKGVNVGYFFDPFGAGEFRAVLGPSVMSNGSGLGPGLDAPATFEAYCVDIAGPIFFPDVVGLPNPPAQFTVQADLMSNWTIAGLGTGGERPDYAGLLEQPAAGQMAAYLYNRNAASFAPGDLTSRTALLMAMWEVLFDVDGSLVTGRFRMNPADGAVLAIATGFLLDLQAHGGSLGDATWLKLTYDQINAQDFVGPGSAAVPEPSMVLFLAIGVGALAHRRRYAWEHLRFATRFRAK